MTEQNLGGGVDRNPIILFDGVCNLCNSSVNFILDRDRKERFRFAALQSDAARAALDAAGAPKDLPDSIVLIDRRGVHLRSDAALRIARRLGVPWLFLSVFLLVPRLLRDPMYSWIARNRYRWFGRQDACRIPTPELRARFLDAGEPVRVVHKDDGAGEVTSETRRGLGLRTLPARFLLIYPIVFMLPTLIGVFGVLGMLYAIPGFAESAFGVALSKVFGFHAMVTQPVVGWLGRMFTGESPSFEFTGSGDGLASYLDVLLDVLVALLLAGIWWVWRRSKPITPRIVDLGRVLLRYYLMSVMFGYGFVKVFPLQFTEMGPDRQLQPYGDSSPMGLLWTFMGASPGYQMFAGMAEVLGGLLLMFRRTTLLGALVVAAVMTNVFAMNMFFDVPVKLYSLHYLLFAIILALPDVPRLFGMFVANVSVAPRDLRPFWGSSRGLSWVFAILKVVIIGSLLYSSINMNLDRMRTAGPWAEVHALRGMYRVESFEVLGDDPAAGDSIEDSERWVRIGMNPPWVATVQCADGKATRMRMALDDDASTLALFDRGLAEPPHEPMEMERLEDGRVQLTGMFEGRSIRVVLVLEEGESLFHSRGFRWINEYPFNR